IAHAQIVALAVFRAWIVDLEEEFQKLAIADLLRIEIDLDRFGMGAVVAIGRVRHIAAGVADPRGDHAGITADQILHAPETAAGENRAFGGYGHEFAPFPESVVSGAHIITDTPPLQGL